MPRFHDEDPVGSAEHFGIERQVGVGGHAGRHHRQARMAGEQLFRSRTAMPVLAADEEVAAA